MYAGISAHGLNINMLYVVILLIFYRQCVGVVSLCEGFMAYAFLFAGIGEYVSVCAGTSAYGLKINIYVVILFNFLRQCVGVFSLCEGFMAYAFLFSGIGEYVVCAGTSAYGLKINMVYVILFNFLRQCVRVVSLCEGFMAYAFLFAGIGEYVVCAGTSAYGLKINMLYVILFNFLRQCVRVVSLCEGFIAYAFLFAGIGEYVLCASVHMF